MASPVGVDLYKQVRDWCSAFFPAGCPPWEVLGLSRLPGSCPNQACQRIIPTAVTMEHISEKVSPRSPPAHLMNFLVYVRSCLNLPSEGAVGDQLELGAEVSSELCSCYFYFCITLVSQFCHLQSGRGLDQMITTTWLLLVSSKLFGMILYRWKWNKIFLTTSPTDF